MNELPEIKVFFSWQSDLPASETRHAIRDGIKTAILKIENANVVYDEAARNVAGSQDIVEKITNCDIFICQIPAAKIRQTS